MGPVIFFSIFLMIALSAPRPGAEEKIEDCLACHQKETRGIFLAWANSRHARHGVDCVRCHRNHQEARAKKSAVEPRICAECHAQKFAQFQESRHAVSWDRMRGHRQYQALPAALQAAFCERCHGIQNRCHSCHSSHAFSAAEAREPEACKKCHTGLAGPHDEMYASSLHGTIYGAQKDPHRSPACIGCHMPRGTHHTGFGLAYDSWGRAVDRNGRPLSGEDQRKAREQMVKEVCSRCHIPSLTVERLELAERVKEQARGVLLEAEGVIRGLEQEGLLPRGVILGPDQMYQGTSRIEALYYRMFRFHSVYTWKGAYHFSADFAHWYGWANLQMSLIEIKEEARKLRELAGLRR